MHGEAKIRRRVELRLHGDPDPAGSNAVGVQLGDEWSMSWAQVRDEALKRGMEDPVLHMHLSKQSAEELRRHIVAVEAARRVMDHRGTPASREGQEARTSMKSRLEGSEAARNEIVRTIVRSARVLQGGGAEIYGDDLVSKLRTGAEKSLRRLFPHFPEGDHRAWQPALKRARQGSGDPFKAVGWTGPVSEHPVSKRVLAEVGVAAQGSAVRRTLESAPYGWPRDAIDAALVALHRDGHLRAERNGQPLATAQLDQTAISKARFRPEKVRLTTGQRVELRKLFGRLGVKAKSGDEEDGGRRFLAALRELAARAGGDPPLPAVPHTGVVDDISHLAGNEQMAAMLERRGEIEAAAEEWGGLAERAEARLTRWELAKALHRHARRELEIADQVGAQLAAIAEQRSLLEATDHVSPRLAGVAGALRKELGARHGELCAAVTQAVDGLETDAIWVELDGPVRAEILGGVGLVVPPALAVETDEALKWELDRRGLAAWRSEIDAVQARVAKALGEAAKRLAGKEVPVSYVRVRLGTLKDEKAVQRWVAEHSGKLTEAVRKGPVIVR